MPSQKPVAPSVEQFLRDYHPSIQELANLVREIVKTALPDAQEKVYLGWQVIGYRVPHGKKTVYVGYIAPQSDSVSLGFEWGVLIDDPDQVLAGQGRQVRFVTISSAAAIESEKFTQFIIEAARVARLSAAEKSHLRQIVKS